MQDKPKQFDAGKWWIKIGVAIFFDVVKWLLLLIPVIGEILGEFADIIFFCTFWLWFKMDGASYSKNTLIAGAVIGAIPILGELIPEWTLAILRLYFDAKAQKVLAK